jgi:hypothetical protein
MKKLMIPVAGLICGLSLLVAPAAHAQGEIETLWEPSQPAIERVDAGDRNTANAAVGELFYNMLCATDSQSHYVIGQKQGQYLKKVVDVPPTQMKNYAPNTIYWWGQVKQGGLKGAQVAGLFKQVSPNQIDARLRIKQTGQKPTDVTVHYQMKLIYQKPSGDKKWEKGGGSGSGGGVYPPGDPGAPTNPGNDGGAPPSLDPGAGNGSGGDGDIVPLPGQ